MPDERAKHNAPRVLLGLLLIVVTATFFFLFRKPGPPAQTSTTLPTSKPSTLPATSKPIPPYTPKSLFDIVKHDLPQTATTQPFEIPLDLRDAAHYRLEGPLYFDRNRLDLWITRPTAPPTPAVLRSAINDQTHVLRDHVLYVHWQPDDSANWFPHLVVSTPTGPHLVYPSGHRLPLPNHPYDFSHPLSYNDLLAIPTPTGVVVLHIQNNQITDHPHILPGLPKKRDGSHLSPNPQSATPNPQSDVQLLLDPRGLLAFLPSSHNAQGSRGVSRFIDNAWHDLTPAQGFPEKLLHLVPLLDGTLLAISPTSRNKVDLHLLPLDSAAQPVDTPAITQLVDDLSHDNETRRQAAFDQLTRYGPSVFPTLEQLLPDQPPESRIRLQQLLRTKLKPTLGPATLIDNELRLVSRHPDGSAIFYSSAGISLPTPDDAPNIITPAWLIARPGQPVRLLPESLTRDLTLDTANLLPLPNELVSLSTPDGPARHLANELVPLLRPNEREFTTLIGIDRRGRWIFTKPQPSGVVSAADHVPTTSPTTRSSSNIQNSEFLILDPTLPDPTPRLPSWSLEVPNGASVGWDQHDNPTLKSGDSAYALTTSDWKSLDLKSDTFTSSPPDFPTNIDRVLRLSKRPSTTTAPASQPGTKNQELGTPLLTTPDGTQYFNARTHLTILTKSGVETTWPLPPEHLATMPPTLLFADNHLFLFNQPGKCLRLTPTPTAKEPFAIDATFTTNIPNTDKPLRIWLDPAGRICHAPDDKHLILFFPTGRIPPEIAQKMPADQLDAQRN